jgi:hypothetical protein
VPVWVGVKVTVKLQVEDAVSVVPQVLPATRYWLLVDVMLVMFSVALPVFVIVTVWPVEVELTISSPKSRLAGLKLTVAPFPVPLRATLRGLP